MSASPHPHTLPAVLPHRLDRTIVIQAPREAVFRFFTDTARWASWWGAGSTIDPRPGGRVLVRHPGGVEAAGEILEIAPSERLVFTYGYVAGTPIPEGASRVSIALEAEANGATRLSLRHEFAEDAERARDEHVQGWRYQLAVFANVVANEQHGDAARVVDGWFDVWAEADADARARQLAAIASAEIHFRDRFGCTDGVADLQPHIAAAQRFMPGIRLSRSGDVRQCQGVVLADWIARGADGQAKATGTSVFVLGADGRIASVTGFWGPAPAPAA